MAYRVMVAVGEGIIWFDTDFCSRSYLCLADRLLDIYY